MCFNKYSNYLPQVLVRDCSSIIIVNIDRVRKVAMTSITNGSTVHACIVFRAEDLLISGPNYPPPSPPNLFFPSVSSWQQVACMKVAAMHYTCQHTHILQITQLKKSSEYANKKKLLFQRGIYLHLKNNCTITFFNFNFMYNKL